MTSLLIVLMALTSVSLVTIGNTSITPFIILFPILFILSLPKIINLKDLKLRYYLFLFISMTVSFFGNFSSSRISSFLYSILFLLYALVLISNLKHSHLKSVEKSFKFIIISYLITTILTFFLTSVGVEIESFELLLKRVWDINSQSYRFMGLSSEPSYAAIIVVTCYMALSHISCHKRFNKSLWAAVVVFQLLLYNSIYGYIMFAIVSYREIIGISKSLYGKILILLMSPFVVYVVFLSSRVDRINNIVKSITSLDLSLWYILDSSSFQRVGPTFVYFKQISLLSWNGMFGNGAASSNNYFGRLFGMMLDENNYTMQYGFIPSYLYDYGMISALSFFLFLRSGGGVKIFSTSIVYFLLVSLNANFNTQLMWFVVSAFFIMGHFGYRVPSDSLGHSKAG